MDEHRPRIRRTALGLALGLAVVCGVLEYQARSTVARRDLDRPFWYSRATQRVAREKVDVFVLGSSRIGLAVTETRLAEILSRRLGRQVTAIDLGLGYSVWTEHALGLQRLIETSPDNVRGAVVLIEAPSGRPPVGSWGQWYHPFSPGLLGLVLRGRDLGGLWQSAEAFDRKVAITLDWIGSKSMLIRHRRMLREAFFASLSNRLFGVAPKEDLANALGGVRTGALTLKDTRLRTVLQGIGLADTAPPGEPNPVEHLVALARRAGMIPLLLDVPEHPGRADLGGYAVEPHQRGRPPLGDVPLLRPDVPLTVDDLPDRVHLRPSTAERFTDALADILAGILAGAGRTTLMTEM